MLRRTLLGLVACLLLAAPASAKSPKNADFKGVWAATTGGWTITSENRHTGVCRGTSSFAGYSLRHCKVTGHKYRFTVLFGTYKSFNTGTFHGNRLTGHFHDTNGTKSSYTATRS